MEDFIVCGKCGGKTEKNSNAQQYCPHCAYVRNLEKANMAAHAKRMKEEGTLGPHPIYKKNGKLNIRAEHNAVLKEMKRLGLRK